MAVLHKFVDMSSIEPNNKFLTHNGRTGEKTMKKVIALSLVIFVTFVAGCAYFNTFYNAEQYFKQGEEEYRNRGQLTSGASTFYRKAIEKSSKVIELYPESKYVDDALYLMGVSYFRLKEYKRAERKFNELLKYFPQSPYADDAKLWLARIYMQTGDFDLARDILKDVGGEEAELMRIRSFLLEGNYAQVIRESEEFLKKYRRSKHKNEVYLYLSEAYASTGHYDLAREYLKKYIRKAQLDEAGYEAMRYRMARLYYLSGDYDSAIATLKKFKPPQRDTLQPYVELLRGMCYEAIGDTSKAKSIYTFVADSIRTISPARIEASYRLARLYEAQDSSELAISQYQKTARLRGESPLRGEADRRYHALMTVSRFSSDTASSDTSASALLTLAETYLFDLNNPTAAESIYVRLADEEAGYPIGAKALYALVYLRLNYLNDTSGAAQAYARLRAWYPGSVYSEEAAYFFGHKISEIADTITVPPLQIPDTTAQVVSDSTADSTSAVQPPPVGGPEHTDSSKISTALKTEAMKGTPDSLKKAVGPSPDTVKHLSDTIKTLPAVRDTADTAPKPSPPDSTHN